ncbi:MAG: hypothetical protein ACJ8GV_02330 [Luteimonas sp.]
MHKTALLMSTATLMVTACASTEQARGLPSDERAAQSAQLQSDRLDTSRHKYRDQEQAVEARREVKALDAQAQGKRQSGTPGD